MDDVRLTVAICTRNRAAFLVRTLHGLLTAAARFNSTWQLLVVDNGSLDETTSVIESFRHRLPLDSVVEPTPGLSHARNTAVRHVTGDYVLWTDDDILVDPDWMAVYARAVRLWPLAAVFGGPIEPFFEGTPPSWMPAALRHVPAAFGALDHGRSPVRLSPQRVPWGGNYMVRTREQRVHLYDPTLGNRPDSRIGREETDLVRRLLATGAEGWWVPAARVRHWIPRPLQTIGHIRFHVASRASFDARSLPPGGRVLFHKPMWLWKRAMLCEGTYRWHRAWSPADIWMRHLKTASHTWGLLRAYSPRSDQP